MTPRARHLLCLAFAVDALMMGAAPLLRLWRAQGAASAGGLEAAEALMLKPKTRRAKTSSVMIWPSAFSWG